MKFDEIRAFMAAVRLSSLSRAAEALSLTRPAVSRRIQGLEASLGMQLFDRNSKPLKATVAGETVYEQCRAIMREVSRLASMELEGESPRYTLRLGVASAIADVALTHSLESLHAEKPQGPLLNAQISIEPDAALEMRVAQDELDAAFAILPTNHNPSIRTHNKPIWTTELVMVRRKGQASRNSLSLSECAEIGWVLGPEGCGIRECLKHACERHGILLRVKTEMPTAELQLKLVAAGFGIGLVPLPVLRVSAYEGGIDIVKVGDFVDRASVWLLQSQTRLASSVAVNALASRLTEFMRKQNPSLSRVSP